MEIQNPARILRFWTKVTVGLEDECWLWSGSLDRKGYGNFSVAKNKSNKAHIFSYVLHYGLFKKGLQVDHKCKIRNCVNPKHLQLLTPKKNNERSSSPSAINAKKIHCVHGHPFDKNNTIRYKDGYRRCKTCEMERRK